jgi:predicted lactoylglutathione lyase
VEEDGEAKREPQPKSFEVSEERSDPDGDALSMLWTQKAGIL